jgi:alpha-beta hydrolase superfamily lysophospholipase
MAYSEKILTAADGIAIFLRIWTPEVKPRALAVLVHGLAEHAGRYKHVVAALLEAGFVVYGHDHRGFGKSGGIRGHWDHFDEVIDDMALVLADAEASWPQLPRAMYAHSMGSVIGIHYLHRFPASFQVAVLSAPGFGAGPRQDKLLMLLMPLAAKIIPRKPLKRKEFPDYTLSHAPGEAEAWHSDPLVHPYSTSRWGVIYLKAAKQAKALMPQLKLPILVIMGEEDITVSREAIQEAVAASGPNVTFHIWPGSYHEPHNELPEIRNAMLTATMQWLEAALFDA